MNKNSDCSHKRKCKWEIYGDVKNEKQNQAPKTLTNGTVVMNCQKASKSYIHYGYYNGGCYSAPHDKPWTSEYLNSLFISNE